jgi:pimeloyl-ACP methyl ester carboxylesterase
MEFAIDPARFYEIRDLPAEEAAVMAANQRPVAELAFSHPAGPPAWRRLPSRAVVATSDKAAGTDFTGSTGQRASSTTTEVDSSHGIIGSQLHAVKYSHRVFEGIGHNVPQEAPGAFTDAILEVDDGLP